MSRKIFYLVLASWCGIAQAADVAGPATADKTTAAPTTATAAPVEAPSTLIVVAGSDLLQTAVGEPLTRYTKQNKLGVKVDMRGTVPALTGLKQGTVQLAIMAAPVGQAPAPPEYTAIKLCFQVDYLIVNKANPLNGLNLRQIASIYGSVQQDASTWGQLQLSGEWTNRLITAYTTSADDGVVLELFKNLVLGQQLLKSSVQIQPTSEDVIKNVTATPNAIGMLGYDPGPPNKVVLVSAEATSSSTADALATNGSKGATLPTEQTVFTGDYPLRLPFYLVYKPADQARLLPLLRLLLSDEYADHIREQHYMPAPATERNRSALELDK